jgi:hypothetical protein
MLLVVFSHGDRRQLGEAWRPAGALGGGLWVMGSLMMSGDVATAVVSALLVSGVFLGMLAASGGRTHGKARSWYVVTATVAAFGVVLLAAALALITAVR